MAKPYTETKRFKELAKEYNKEMDKKFPVKRKYTKSGKIRKKHEMTKRQNLGSKRSVETPPDKRGNFYLSENVSDWYGAKCTAKFPNLF